MPDQKSRWLVSWHHDTDSSSFWGDIVVSADDVQEAARCARRQVDLVKHTRPTDRRLRVRVYGPIPSEYEEFYVSDSILVEAA